MARWPPQVLCEGTKKTVFCGFHGSLQDGKNSVCIGSQTISWLSCLLNWEQVDHLMDSKDEYVICIGCKSPDTILSKENRHLFLRCKKCGSIRSVAPIKAGFVAPVGRRNTET